jgi:voltage-gated potassium channel
LRQSRSSFGVRDLGRVTEQRREELLTVVLVLLVLLLMASTVGYGDVITVTVVGRMIAGVIAILGIGLFALPAGILGSGFLEELHQRQRSLVRVCPHCGGEVHD